MSFKHIIVILLVLISFKYVYSYESSIDYTISEPYALLEYNDVAKIYEKCVSDSDIQDYISKLNTSDDIEKYAVVYEGNFKTYNHEIWDTSYQMIYAKNETANYKNNEYLNIFHDHVKTTAWSFINMDPCFARITFYGCDDTVHLTFYISDNNDYIIYSYYPHKYSFC